MPADATDLARRKSELRKAARQARKTAAAEWPDAGAALSAAFTHNIHTPDGTVVAAYWPMASEIDVRPLMTALAAAECTLCLPVVAAPDRALVFRRWRPGDTLVPAGFGTSEPKATAEKIEPDILLVPLLAFDRRGHRLGYGGGFYDRTLAAARGARRILAIGVAYAAQEMAEVPTDSDDQPLDMIVTDKGLIRV